MVESGDWRDEEERVLPMELMTLGRRLIALWVDGPLISEKMDGEGMGLAGGMRFCNG